MRGREAGALHKRQQEASKAAVQVQADPVIERERRESRYVVDRSVAILRRRADEADGVRIDEMAHLGNVDLLAAMGGGAR